MFLGKFENEKKLNTFSSSNKMGTYPGAYSGRIILYPKALKAKPTGSVVIAEDNDFSANIWNPSDVPGCLMPIDISVTVTAMPSAIAIFAKKDISIPVLVLFPFSCTLSTILNCSPTLSSDTVPPLWFSESWHLILCVQNENYGMLKCGK